MSKETKKATETTDVTAAPEKAPAKTVLKAAAVEPVVYLGPTIERVVLKGTVFEGDLPALLQARIEEQPIINGLIFPISQYAAKAAEVNKKGSALYNIASKVKTK